MVISFSVLLKRNFFFLLRTNLSEDCCWCRCWKSWRCCCLYAADHLSNYHHIRRPLPGFLLLSCWTKNTLEKQKLHTHRFQQSSALSITIHLATKATEKFSRSNNNNNNNKKQHNLQTHFFMFFFGVKQQQ